MKDPDECANIHEVREEIDIIDREVIDALSKRFKYVVAAARFKSMGADVPALRSLLFRDIVHPQESKALFL